nr:hypothetical protein [Microbacterium lacticum]
MREHDFVLDAGQARLASGESIAEWLERDVRQHLRDLFARYELEGGRAGVTGCFRVPDLHRARHVASVKPQHGYYVVGQYASLTCETFESVALRKQLGEVVGAECPLSATATRGERYRE